MYWESARRAVNERRTTSEIDHNLKWHNSHWSTLNWLLAPSRWHNNHIQPWIGSWLSEEKCGIKCSLRANLHFCTSWPTLAVTIYRAVTMFTGNRMSDDKRGGNIYGLTILFAGNTSNTSPISLNFLQYLRNLNPAHLVTVMSLLTITEMGWATENWFTHTGGYNKRTMQNYCLCKFISLFGKEEGDTKYLCAWDQNVPCSAQNKTTFCSVLCYNWMATHARWKPDAHFLLGGQTDAGCHSAFGGCGSGELCCKGRSYVAGLHLGDPQLLIAVLHFRNPMSASLAIKTYSTWQRSVNLGWPEMEEALLLQGSRC